LEEEKMSNNTNELTAKEIFAQLTILQKQLTENSNTSLHRLGDAITSIGEEDNEARYEQVTEVCSVFKTREITLLKMLEMYEKMYADVQRAETMELIKNIRLSTLQDLKEFYSEEELVERADTLLCDITSLCNDIYFVKT